MFAERRYITELTRLLVKVCDDQTLANLMNATICADADERLTDREAGIAERFFDALTNAAPQSALSLAHGH